MNVPHRDDATLGMGPDSADHDLPRTVDDVDAALHDTDARRPLVPFLDVARRFNRIGERAGFPRGADDRAFPLDDALAHPRAVLPRRSEALPAHHLGGQPAVSAS